VVWKRTFTIRRLKGLLSLKPMQQDGIYGLVIAGGKSSRMGREKHLLHYHGMPQYQHVYELLKPYCTQVFLSCNNCEALTTDPPLEVLADLPVYSDTGPIAGILSAFHRQPDKDWLVIACDYPLITSDEISGLVACQNQTNLAAAFYNKTSGFFEPLLAVYKAGCFPLLEENFRQGQYSLQQFLKAQGAVKCYTAFEHRLQSVDTPADYEQALKQISSQDY